MKNPNFQKNPKFEELRISSSVQFFKKANVLEARNLEEGSRCRNFWHGANLYRQGEGTLAQPHTHILQASYVIYYGFFPHN